MNMKRTKVIPTLFALLLAYSVSIAAPSGRITGRVFDSKDKKPLPAANVFIEGTTLGASTDLDGDFVIPQVPPGTYELVIRYIGYQTKTIGVTVTVGEELKQEIGLDFETVEGEVVEITAQAVGQLAAINQQLASDKIANIVSEARIQELPDFNAAAALSRLPGISTTKSSGEDNKVVIRGLSPKYNSIEVEGVKLSATGSSSIGLTSDVYVNTGGVQNDRSVDLTMVSPYMIRTIAVYKSLTPDMNANSIGGTVNMELREAPSGFHTDFLVQQGYTAKSETYRNYRIVASGSNRFFDNRLGVYALINAESYDRDADNLGAGYDQASSQVDPVTEYRPVKVINVTFNRHIETRDRYGANLILDYEIANGSLKFVNMFARLNSDYIEHRQDINYNNGRLAWALQSGENTTDQQLHSLKLDYDLGFLTVDLSASYTASSNVLDDSPVINFNQVGGVIIDDRDNQVPQDLSFLVQYAGNDNVVLRSGNLFSNDYQEDKLTYKADFELPFNIGNAASGIFKFGGELQNQSNSTDQEAPYLGFGANGDIDGEGIQASMTRAIRDNFGLTTDSNGDFTGNLFFNNNSKLLNAFLDDRYGDIYFLSQPTQLVDMMRYIVGNPAFDASDTDNSIGREGGWYDGPYQRLTNDYSFDENYYAAYAMTNFNFLDFTLVGGARYEKVKSDYFAYNARDIRNAQEQKMYDTTSVSENEFVLPMGQIKYTPLEWMDIRYAYTQTLSRPDYQQLTPKFTITQNNQVFAGNPDLKPAKAFNHDVSLSFHSNKLGLLSIGAFHKTVDGFVYGANYRLDAAQNAGIDSLPRYQVIRNGMAVVNPVRTDVTVFRPLNNPNEATVKGIEFDFQHSLWYAPGLLSNVVFGINYARIASETRYPFFDVAVIPQPRPNPPLIALVDSSSAGRLIDQPNHVLNSFVGYDYKGFSGRLSMVYTDNSARNNGGQYPENDSFTDAYLRLDFSARQKLPYLKSELFLDVSNLNDRNTRWVQKSTGGYQGIENYGLTANLGIRFRY